MIKVIDKSKNGIYNSNMELVDSFSDYSSKNLDFDKPVTIEFLDDEENAKNPLGTTAHYSPDQLKITIYVTGRHIKDILRSASHELIHHVQNCRGDLTGMQDTSLGYAQRDKHMRDMETEAFNSGNIMNFRDFEDNYKQGNRKMSKLQENRLKKLNGLLMGQEREAIEEQAVPKTRKGSYKGVEYTGDPKVSGIGTFTGSGYLVRIIADCRKPKTVAAYIRRQAQSDYVNDNELLALTLGLESCAKKGKIGDILSTYGGLQKTEDLYKYLTQRISMGMPTAAALRQRIYDVLANPKTKADPNPKTKADLKKADVDYAGVEQAGKAIMDIFKSQGKEITPDQAKKLAASPKGKKMLAKATSKGPRKYRKCTGILRMGCGGDNIEVLQRKLHNVLKLKSNVDSFADKKFGPGTKRAVKAFQRTAKLKDDGVAGPDTLKALDAAVAGKLGIATPKGPAAGLNPEKLGMEVDNIFKQVVTDYPLVPQNERDPEYIRVRRQVMDNIRTELGSGDDKRREYATGDGKISRLKMAQKIRLFITQAMRG